MNPVRLVSPTVYLIGYTTVDWAGLQDYLYSTGNLAFMKLVEQARRDNLSDGEILCSFYAKFCYLSLTEGKNKNIKKVRGILGNLHNTINQAHFSVFEHALVNFVAHDASRVFEAELIRHRVGTAFSIESGRYKRTDSYDFVTDPVLEPVRKEIEALQAHTIRAYQRMAKKLGVDNITDRDEQKAVTSALRRVLPEGKAKEIGFSINFRALRHLVQLRTSRHAEHEIRDIFGQVYRLTASRFSTLYYGAREAMHKGLLEVSGMKIQPWEQTSVPIVS